MTQLIHMRQRIKAIDTIKKVTHAMRLISMSTHSHLKGKERSLHTYTQAIKQLFQFIKKQTPSWTNPIIEPNQSQSKKTLIVLIGSQKGLCGNFNTALFKLFDINNTKSQEGEFFYIAIGKKALSFLHEKKNVPTSLSFPEFSSSHVHEITHAVANHIMTEQYTQIVFLSNVIKTFFVQKPRITSLIPLEPISDPVENPIQEYSWQQDPHQTLNILLHQYIEATIHNILFQSLLAEQAARFISMDNSTRNAKKLLELTTIQYNKFRQTKITRELSELASSFQ